MSTAERLLGETGIVLLVATLVGLVVTGRFRLWYTFALSLVIVAAHEALVALWPAQFYRGAVWRSKEVALQLVRLAMVIELVGRVFRHFPGALGTARRALAAIVVLTVLMALVIPIEKSGYSGFVGELMPRLINGTIWLFTAVAGLVLWYRLPVHWFQKAILTSYVPYLLVFTVAMNSLGALGWQRGQWVNVLNSIAYTCLVLYWTYTAWRTEPRRPLGDSASPPSLSP